MSDLFLDFGMCSSDPMQCTCFEHEMDGIDEHVSWILSNRDRFCSRRPISIDEFQDDVITHLRAVVDYKRGDDVHADHAVSKLREFLTHPLESAPTCEAMIEVADVLYERNAPKLEAIAREIDSFVGCIDNELVTTAQVWNNGERVPFGGLTKGIAVDPCG